jgi:imidazole glycerol-phosphate synthase subunit HisH
MKTVAIIDYGMGNLFSVKNALEHVGLRGLITSDLAEVAAADAVVLPGVGAFGDAMASLESKGLAQALKEYAASSRPLVGICLGFQLLMSESEEFGLHPGLGIIPGKVRHFGSPSDAQGALKVPHVGWNQIVIPPNTETSRWENSPLRGLNGSTYMYFVHSYYVVPDAENVCLANSRYGDVEFCSAVSHENVSAFQFHPERSGDDGIHIYRNIANFLKH